MLGFNQRRVHLQGIRPQSQWLQQWVRFQSCFHQSRAFLSPLFHLFHLCPNLSLCRGDRDPDQKIWRAPDSSWPLPGRQRVPRFREGGSPLPRFREGGSPLQLLGGTSPLKSWLGEQRALEGRETPAVCVGLKSVLKKSWQTKIRKSFIFLSEQSLTRCKKAQSRREREIQKQFLHIREEKEKSEFLCLVSRGEREISNFLAQFREQKEKPEFIFPVSRGEREISNSFAQFREEK